MGADFVARGIANRSISQFTVKENYAYNTGNGLRRWRAAKASAELLNAGIINVVALGQSITEGRGGTDWTYGWLNIMRTKFATLYGDVGTGFIPVYFPYGAALWTFAGTWTDISTFGVTNSCKRSTVNGSTASLAFNGTGIDIMVVKGTTQGTFESRIDGGAPTTFDANNASTVGAFIFSITGLGAGDHTLEITNTVTGGKQLTLIGACPTKGTNGVRFHMVGRYAIRVVSSMNTDYAMQAEIDIWTPKLTLLEFACNDYHDGTVVSTYKSQLQTLISRAQQFGDCLLIASGTYTDSPSSASIPYRQAMLDLAIQNNCAYLDIIGRWGEDGLYAKETLDFIDDTIHPNNAGHRDYATAIANVLLETL